MNKELALSKKLRSQLEKIKTEIELLRTEVKVKNTEIYNKKNNVKQLSDKIKKLEDNSNKDLVISEHAILRYLERIIGLDLNKLKKEIITNELKEVVKDWGSDSGSFIKKGVEYVIKNNVIITIKK